MAEIIEGETTYEYCRIKYQVQDMGYDTTQAGPHKLIWGQFLAVVESPEKSYVAARSERFALANTIGGQPYPDARNLGHRNLLDVFVQALRQDGWKTIGSAKGELWWEMRLRRPQPISNDRPTLKQRLVRAFSS